MDAEIQYECTYDGTTYILVMRNALYVESMVHNLIPPFVIREAGIMLNDTPKIQIDDPGVEHHSIYFEDTKFRIPLSLWGTFSYIFKCQQFGIHILQRMLKMRRVCLTDKVKWWRRNIDKGY